MTKIGKLASGFLLAAAVAGPATGRVMQAAPDDDAAAQALDAATKALNATSEPCDPSTPCKADAGMDAAPADDQVDNAPAEKAIDEPFGNAWLGAADGDVTLVLFVDYACPACREAQSVVDALLASDRKLKVVYRILVNEDEGRDAAVVSLALAQSHADWARFHRTLDAGGTPTKRTLAAAMTAAGEDAGKLSALIDSDTVDIAVSDELVHNGNAIFDREGKSVPSWLIGDEKAHGGVSLEEIEAGIAQARRAKAGGR